MKKILIPEDANINFEVRYNSAGVSNGCKDCNQKIHTKNFYVEVTIDGKLYLLSNSDEFLCPFCNASKSIAILFDDLKEAEEYLIKFVSDLQTGVINYIPLIDTSSGIRINGAGAQNAHLN